MDSSQPKIQNKVTTVEHATPVGLGNFMMAPPPQKELQDHIDLMNKDGWELLRVDVHDHAPTVWFCIWKKEF